MKNIFVGTIVLIILLLSSCSDKDEDIIGQKSYTFIFSMDNRKEMDREIVLYEYDRSDKMIKSNEIINPEKDKEYTFLSNERAKSIKVYSILTNKVIESDIRKLWVQQIYLLDNDRVIKITRNTRTAESEPQ